MKTKNKNGSALYIVFIFSIVTSTATYMYVMGQYNFARIAFKKPQITQALCNARSGIWYGMAMLDKQIKLADDSLSFKDTLMPDFFNLDLFKGFEPDNIGVDSLNEKKELSSGGEPLKIVFFDSLTFGFFSIALENSGNFRTLQSEGFFRDSKKKVVAIMGSQPFTNPDTVLFLDIPGKPMGSGFVDGTVAFIPRSIDQSDSLMRKRFFVDEEEIQSLVESNMALLNGMADSVAPQTPLTIKYNDDLSTIPDTVEGPLLIDGSVQDIYWKEKRTVYVLEDLQITQDVYIENVQFLVRGEIRINDKAELQSVSLFTGQRLFLEDQTIFNGTAISCADIEITGDVMVTKKSTLISTGYNKRKEEVKSTKTRAAGGKPEKVDPLKVFSLYIRDRSFVDGVCIDLRKIGGIYTGMETMVSGILWAKGRVCHTGTMKGVVKTTVLVGPENTMDVTKNILEGTIKQLEYIKEYYMPYYIGRSKIIDWQE